MSSGITSKGLSENFIERMETSKCNTEKAESFNVTYIAV